MFLTHTYTNPTLFERIPTFIVFFLCYCRQIICFAKCNAAKNFTTTIFRLKIVLIGRFHVTRRSVVARHCNLPALLSTYKHRRKTELKTYS